MEDLINMGEPIKTVYTLIRFNPKLPEAMEVIATYENRQDAFQAKKSLGRF